MRFNHQGSTESYAISRKWSLVSPAMRMKNRIVSRYKQEGVLPPANKRRPSQSSPKLILKGVRGRFGKDVFKSHYRCQTKRTNPMEKNLLEPKKSDREEWMIIANQS